MREAADAGSAVDPITVANGDFGDLEVLFGGPEDEIKVPEGSKSPKKARPATILS